MKKPFTTLVVLLFSLGALVHLLRFYVQFQIIIGSHTIPIWMSGVFIIVFGILGYGLYKEKKE